VSFKVKISWWYILSQIWIYPTIILSLIVWRVRARRKKKKRKKELEAAAQTKVISAGSGKGGLSDTDFATLSGGYNPNAGYDPTAPNSGDFDLYNDEKNYTMYDDEPWN